VKSDNAENQEFPHGHIGNADIGVSKVELSPSAICFIGWAKGAGEFENGFQTSV
jgi:hypothetical protein